MTLVSETATHHICLRHLPTAKNMLIVRTHDNIILFYNSYATYLIVIIIPFYLILVQLLRMAVVLLALHDVSTEHLGVLNFNLGIIEDIVIIVDVLYYLYWLLVILILLLWF